MDFQVLKELLVNLLFIILPIYLYMLFGKNIPHSIRGRNVIFGLTGSILIVLVMTFPITIVEKHMFDLRQVPIIIGFLYLGGRIGTTLFITFLVVRSYWGGSGVYGAILVNSVLVFLLYFVQHKFASLSVKNKCLLTSALTLISCLLINLVFLIFYEITLELLLVTSLLFAVQSIGLFIVIYSIEKVKRDIFIERKLQETAKAQMVSELAAAVSHEVRNPLTVTKGFLQFVISQPLPEQTREHLRMAQAELAHAENVINDYLTFAKPALETSSPLNLTDEISKFVKFVTPYANMQSIQITFCYDADLKVIGEAQKFHQCISNIIKNSIEAMPSGGVIAIDLSQSDHKIIINISDTGVGMSAEELQRLGEPYFSTKEKGTGLGMMVVFGIIRSMKGKINVTSELGRGTQFRIEFPFTDPSGKYEKKGLLPERKEKNHRK